MNASAPAPRLDFYKTNPGITQAMLGLESYLGRTGLDPRLVRLVKLRASQLNGCAYCLDLHVSEALAAGETPLRIYLLDARREAPVYSAKEQAALAWTEAVTRLSDGVVSDEVYAQVAQHFSETDLANLTLAVVAINGWNRLNVAFRYPPALRTAEGPATP
jgi:AhpD family alkylhydroperoxidase